MFRDARVDREHRAADHLLLLGGDALAATAGQRGQRGHRGQRHRGCRRGPPHPCTCTDRNGTSFPPRERLNTNGAMLMSPLASIEYGPSTELSPPRKAK